MIGRQYGDALAQKRFPDPASQGRTLLDVGTYLDRCGRLIIRSDGIPAPQDRQGLEPVIAAPGGKRQSGFECRPDATRRESPTSADGSSQPTIPSDAAAQAIDPDHGAPIQHLQGQPVSLRDPGDQAFVRLACTRVRVMFGNWSIRRVTRFEQHLKSSRPGDRPNLSL